MTRYTLPGLLMRPFTFTVTVTPVREYGKFISREDVAEQILEALEGADPGQVEGGADGDNVYTIDEWTVTGDE